MICSQWLWAYSPASSSCETDLNMRNMPLFSFVESERHTLLRRFRFVCGKCGKLLKPIETCPK